MKISKTNLRQIIKEELGSLSEEENYGGRVPTYPELKRHPRKAAHQEFTNYLLKMYQDLSETADIATIREIIQDNFNSALKAAEDVFLGDDELDEPAPEELEL